MPTTPFEDTATASLTSLAQEATYVNALLAEQPGLTKVVVGQSVEGRDIYALITGTDTGKRPLLYTAGVHGDEKVPRECALTLIRDLHTTTDPALVGLLAQRQVWVVPTVNPDCWNVTRYNANGDDINRHYLTLTAPESTAVATLVRDLDPVAILDAHEWIGKADGLDTYVGDSTFVHVPQPIFAASRAIGEDMMAAVAARGRSTGWYPMQMPMGSINHLAPMQGRIFNLMETVDPYAQDLTGRPARYQDQRTAAFAWLDHLTANADAYDDDTATAMRQVAAKVAARRGFWPIDVQVPNPASTEGVGQAVYATAYSIVDPADVALVGPLLDAHGVERSNGTVMLNQPFAHVAVALLDPLSPRKVPTGQVIRWTGLPPWVAAPSSGDTLASVVSAFAADGSTA